MGTMALLIALALYSRRCCRIDKASDGLAEKETEAEKNTEANNLTIENIIPLCIDHILLKKLIDLGIHVLDGSLFTEAMPFTSV